jgi:hypothetical protein
MGSLCRKIGYLCFCCWEPLNVKYCKGFFVSYLSPGKKLIAGVYYFNVGYSIWSVDVGDFGCTVLCSVKIRKSSEYLWTSN